MPGRPELRHTNREAIAEDYLDVASRRPGGDPYGRAPPVRGTGAVSGILANGRVIRLRVRERPVALEDVDRLVGIVRRMGEEGDAAIRARRQAIVRLSRSVSGDADRLAKQSAAGNRRLAAQLLAGKARLERRISKELLPLGAEIDKMSARHAALLGRVRRRAVWDALVVVSALPLFAAYGQPGNPFAPNNLVLTLSVLVWLLGDDLTDLLSGSAGSAFGIRDTDIWSYIAPFANLLTGWFLLRHSQHERFVTGFAADLQPFRPAGALPRFGASDEGVDALSREIAGDSARGARERLFTFRQDIDLAPHIAPDHLGDFQNFTGVPAVASLARLVWAPGLADPDERRIVGVSAEVEDGILRVIVTVAVRELRKHPESTGGQARPLDHRSILEALRVAWIVDTAKS